MTRAMAYTLWNGSHVVLVNGPAPPTDDEWKAYVRDVERWLPDLVGTMIVTDGGGPTSAQRRELKEVFSRNGRASVRTAVLSNSLMVRGIVNALNLFNPGIRVFRPDAVDEALAYIGAALDGPALLAEVEWLRGRLRP
jgi:hypothetical protein